MNLALAEYYGSKDHFGVDFITAPEVSQMFGEMVGLWLVQAWKDQGKPGNFHLVEFGPGRGTLMADILRVAEKIAPDFLPDVVLVENSEVLKNYQRIKLSNASRVRWATHFEKDLEGAPLFVVANEFFDALPIRQYVKTERGWCERMVVLNQTDELEFALAPVASGLKMEGELGAVYEVCPTGTALMEEVAGVIAEKGGAALVVDYGYAGGLGETLQAVRASKFAGVLDKPGETDLSAHVDFAALASAAKSAGAEVWGPTGQGAFLKELGIERRAEQLILANPLEARSVDSALQRLVSAGEMGSLFKAMAVMPTGFKPVGF